MLAISQEAQGAKGAFGLTAYIVYPRCSRHGEEIVRHSDEISGLVNQKVMPALDHKRAVKEDDDGEDQLRDNHRDGARD